MGRVIKYYCDKCGEEIPDVESGPNYLGYNGETYFLCTKHLTELKTLVGILK